MSRVDEIIKNLKVTVYDLGLAEVARLSKVSDDSIRRLLKDPPQAVKNLMALEAVAEAHLNPTQATGAEETGETQDAQR